MCTLNASEGDSGSCRRRGNLESRHVESALSNAENHPEMQSRTQILHLMFPYRGHTDFAEIPKYSFTQIAVTEVISHIEKINLTEKRIEEIIFYQYII